MPVLTITDSDGCPASSNATSHYHAFPLMFTIWKRPAFCATCRISVRLLVLEKVRFEIPAKTVYIALIRTKIEFAHQIVNVGQNIKFRRNQPSSIFYKNRGAGRQNSLYVLIYKLGGKNVEKSYRAMLQ